MARRPRATPSETSAAYDYNAYTYGYYDYDYTAAYGMCSSEGLCDLCTGGRLASGERRPRPPYFPPKRMRAE